MREVVIRRFCAHCYRHGRRTELASGHSEYTIVVNEFGAKTDLCDGCAQTVLVPLLEMMSAGEDLSALSRQDWALLGGVFPRTAAIRKLNGPASIKPATAEPDAAFEPVAAQLVPGKAADQAKPADEAKPAQDKVKPAKATPRKRTAPGRSPGRSKAAADRSHVCQGCGQTFTRAANLAIHVNRFGTGAHQRPARRGAALIADPAPQHLAPQHLAPQHLAPQHLAPQHLAPQHLAPQHLALQDAAPQDAAQETASAPAQQ